MILVRSDLTLGLRNFQVIQDKFSLGELYGFNIIIMKKNINNSGVAMFQY